MSVLTIGQVVELCSGGPRMSIYNQAEGTVDCCWLDKELVYHQRNFNVNLLTPINVDLPKTGLPKVGAVVALRSQPDHHMTIVKINGDQMDCIWATKTDNITETAQSFDINCLTSPEITTKYYDVT